MKKFILLLFILTAGYLSSLSQQNNEVDPSSISFTIDKASNLATDKAAIQDFSKRVADKLQELFDQGKLLSGASKNIQQHLLINCRFVAGQYDGLVESIKIYRNENQNQYLKRYGKAFIESYIQSAHLQADTIAFKKNYAKVFGTIFQKLTLDDLPRMEQNRSDAQNSNAVKNWNDFIKTLPADSIHSVNFRTAIAMITAYMTTMFSGLQETEWSVFNSIIAKLENSKGNPIAAQFSLPEKPIAITHIHILNTITGKVDADQTILVEKELISAVGNFKNITIPSHFTVLDATGKFAMPGMTDGHIHFFQSGGLYTRPEGSLKLQWVYPYDKDQNWLKDNLYDLMARYVACGVTNVVDVGGPMRNFAIRENVNQEITSPNALVTGPLISTVQPIGFDKNDLPIIKANSPEEARELVRKQLPFKPDFIKIWFVVTLQGPAHDLPMVRAAIEESHANGLKVCVHAQEYETAKLAVEAGADILVHSVTNQPLDASILRLFKEKNIVYIPTLQVVNNYFSMYTQQFSFAPHDFKYANPFMLGSIMDLQHLDSKKTGVDYLAIRKNNINTRTDSIELVNLLAVQRAGIHVVAGTDAGNIGTHHGSSFIAELQLMKDAGLTNWDVLKSATINSARAFGKEKVWGSLEKGKIADILLLDSNPLDDLNVLAEIPTIIHRGVMLKSEQLLPVTPEILVQQQLNAYNARDIEAFLLPYSDSIELYNFPNQLLLKGKQEMRKSYADLFKNTPDLHCELVNRIKQGSSIIDHERLSGNGTLKREAVAIFKIENGKISKAYFSRD